MEETQMLCEYLSHAKDLETTIYTQKKIMNNLQQRIQALKLKENNIIKPSEPHLSNITKYVIANFSSVFVKAAIISALIYAILVIYLLVSPALTTVSIMIRNTIIAILFSLGFGAISGAIKANEIIKQYHEKMNSYKESLNYYTKEKEKEKLRLDHAKMEKEFLLKQYYEIENTLNQTKDTLTNYYSNNIIYPKYLTMTGVAQILEYLELGRCNTLTGPDGAYNLYENELRMNNIIGNLDIIVKDLEEIKNTQYMIYNEIVKGNEIASQILDAISDACDSLNSIAVNSSVSAFNSEVIKNNINIMRLNSSY